MIQFFSPPGSTPGRGQTKPPIQRPSWYTSREKSGRRLRLATRHYLQKKLGLDPTPHLPHMPSRCAQDNTVSTCRLTSSETAVCSHAIIMHSHASYTTVLAELKYYETVFYPDPG